MLLPLLTRAQTAFGCGWRDPTLVATYPRSVPQAFLATGRGGCSGHTYNPQPYASTFSLLVHVKVSYWRMLTEIVGMHAPVPYLLEQPEHADGRASIRFLIVRLAEATGGVGFQNEGCK